MPRWSGYHVPAAAMQKTTSVGLFGQKGQGTYLVHLIREILLDSKLIEPLEALLGDLSIQMSLKTGHRFSLPNQISHLQSSRL